ncbi:unnamed protein product [Sympodiomycopsis kandeliae]
MDIANDPSLVIARAAALVTGYLPLAATTLVTMSSSQMLRQRSAPIHNTNIAPEMSDGNKKISSTQPSKDMWKQFVWATFLFAIFLFAEYLIKDTHTVATVRAMALNSAAQPASALLVASARWYANKWRASKARRLVIQSGRTARELFTQQL